MVEEDTRRLWPRGDDIPAEFRPNGEGGDSVFIADQLQRLVPRDDTQRSLKTQATSLVLEFGQLRSMLTAQSMASISRPMLIVVICWLMLIFLSFSLLAPSNPTATVALIASTLSVAGRNFPDPGDGFALRRHDPNFQQADAQSHKSSREMKTQLVFIGASGCTFQGQFPVKLPAREAEKVSSEKAEIREG